MMMTTKDPTLDWSRTSVSDLDLTGTNVAVIGGTGGIGRAITRSLASRGARVTVVGRTFRDAGLPGVEFLEADLELMSEAARVAAELPAETLDLVVLTTGIIAAPGRQETAEGLERDLAVSYLSRLVILRGIAGRLGTERPAGRPRPRVFVMGFPGAGQAGTPDDLNAERSYQAMPAHMNTVAGNETLVLDSAARYPGIDVFGLNPGFVRSDIRANLFAPGSRRHRAMETVLAPVMAKPDTYARRVTPLLVAPDLEHRSGAMFDRRARAIRPTAALTPARVTAFVTASEDLVARAGVPVA